MNGSEQIIEELRALVAEQAAKLEEQAARIAELELALAKAIAGGVVSGTGASDPAPRAARQR
jgi:hypothetical protein